MSRNKVQHKGEPILFDLIKKQTGESYDAILYRCPSGGDAVLRLFADGVEGHMAIGLNGTAAYGHTVWHAKATRSEIDDGSHTRVRIKAIVLEEV